MSLTCEVVTITRELAVQYLAAKGGNRSLSDSHVTNLASRQARGEWIPNGDTIRFDSAGLLRDGQHRLEMVVRTGVAIETIVVKGIDPNAFVTIDTGRTRGLGDVLSIAGYENHSQLAGALRFVYSFLRYRHTSSAGGYSHEQYQRILEKHRGLIESVSFFLGIEKPAGAPGYPGQSIAAHYLFSQVSPEAATDFVECLVTGLRMTDASDPVSRLRGQLIEYARPRILKPSSMQVFDMFVLAWNARQQGRPQKVRYQLLQATPRIRGFPPELFEVGKMELEEIGELDNGVNMAA